MDLPFPSDILRNTYGEASDCFYTLLYVLSYLRGTGKTMVKPVIDGSNISQETPILESYEFDEESRFHERSYELRARLHTRAHTPRISFSFYLSVRVAVPWPISHSLHVLVRNNVNSRAPLKSSYKRHAAQHTFILTMAG